MDPEKKKRLEAAGWRFGTVKEFLGLSDAEAEYVELKVALSIALRERHRRRKKKFVDRSTTLDKMFWELYHLGATNAEIGRIISLARPPA